MAVWITAVDPPRPSQDKIALGRTTEALSRRVKPMRGLMKLKEGLDGRMLPTSPKRCEQAR